MASIKKNKYQCKIGHSIILSLAGILSNYLRIYITLLLAMSDYYLIKNNNVNGNILFIIYMSNKK